MSPPQLDTTFFALGRRKRRKDAPIFFSQKILSLYPPLLSALLLQKGNFLVCGACCGGTYMLVVNFFILVLSASIHSLFYSSSHVFSHALHFAKKKNGSRIISQREKTDLLLEFHIHKGKKDRYMSMFTCYPSLLAVAQGQSFDTDTAVLYESPFLEWVSSIIAAESHCHLFLHRPKKKKLATTFSPAERSSIAVSIYFFAKEIH